MEPQNESPENPIEQIDKENQDEIDHENVQEETGRPSQKDSLMTSLETSTPSTEIDKSIALELGDIIEIVAPTNPTLHQTTHLVTYVDSVKIKLLNVATGVFHQLNIVGGQGRLSDESIIQLILLSRSEESGYARQNGLLPRVWVDIHFGGEIPAIITAEITNLEEDMIELTTFPELRVLYIDFAYQGIPETIPIESIVLREKPATMGNIDSVRELQSYVDEEGSLEEALSKAATPLSDQASIELSPTGESILTVPENVKPDENIRHSLHTMYIDAHSIVFGERLPEIANLVEIPEHQQRYSIETQANDLMDELLSTIPNSQRTKLVLDTVHLLIERFKELRQQYSHFDIQSNVQSVKTYGPFYKPLVERVLHMDTKLAWLLPVVKNRRKIYDTDRQNESEDILLENLADTLIEVESKQLEYSKNTTDATLAYSTYHSFLNTWSQPVELPTEGDGPAATCIAKVPVHTELTALTDNLGEFYATTLALLDAEEMYRGKTSIEGLLKKRFVQQTYTTSLTHLDEQVSHTGKKVYTRVPVAENESLCLKSVLLFPQPVAQYSTLFLPGTALMDSVTLHQTPFYLFRVLNRALDIPVYQIDDLNKEIDYKEDGQPSWLKEIREFSLDMSVLHETDLFEKMMQLIVPKTIDLLNSVPLSIPQKTSFSAVVSTLRPFMVFTENITYSQYKVIRFFIKENLQQLRINMDKRLDMLVLLQTAKYTTEPLKINPVLRLLNENPEYGEEFFQGYFLPNNETTPLASAELLARVYATDNGRLYTNFIASILVSVLNTPAHILDGFVPAELDDLSTLEKIKATDPTVRHLAKLYSSIAALQKDNNVDDLFYDKDFDDTPYDILDRYRDKQTEMSPDLFFEFLMENLIQKHQCSKETARDLATTLIAKKKRVADGDYALVEIIPHLPKDVDANSLSATELASVESEAEIRKKTEYYKRKKGVWVLDPDINKEAFLDNATLFANISATFFKKGEKQKCEDVTAAMRMKQIAAKNLTKELENRVTIHSEDLAKTLENNIDYYLKSIRRLNLLKDIQLYRADRIAYALGSYANKEELVVSPHMELVNLITGQDDFAKKQFDICRFVETFCREPMVAERDEEPYWFYCKDTNTKLFPCSLYQLADVFVSGGNYLEELNTLCRTDGMVSDDGDAIVDRHTGVLLRKIDFVTEDGFTEEGFRITSHAILEKDIATVLQEAKTAAHGRKGQPVFENEDNQTVYNVCFTLCDHLDVPIDAVEEFVLRISTELMMDKKIIMPEDIYARYSAKQEKDKGKKMKPYKKYRDEIIMNIVPSVLLVAIQTATPSFRTRKTFPGCVRSFSGYPLGGMEDSTAIQYIACVVKKTATTTAISPWESVKGYKPEILSERMKDAMKNYLLKRSDIDQLFQQKREYMILHPDTTVPEEHSISRWRRFLPPVVPFEIVARLRPISSDFSQDLMDLLRNGKRGQYASLAALHSKIVEYGYAIIEIINLVVHSKTTLLKTGANIPFLENACCNESLLANPFLYFKTEDARIMDYTKHVNTIRKLSSFVQDISIAPMFYHVPFTGITFPTVSAGQLEETIYAAVIHYCHLDRPERPIPTAMIPICSEKPAEYVTTWSLLEKMEFLKRNGKRYNLDTLHQLMHIVSEQNRVDIAFPLSFSDTDAFREILEHFHTVNSSLIGEQLRNKLMATLETYQPKQMRSAESESPALKDLKRYLELANHNMFRSILSFMTPYVSDRQYEKIGDFLKHICDWNGKRHSDVYYDDELFRISQFVKNMVYMLSRVYPTVLQGDEGFSAKVHKHWGLSEKHALILSKVLKKYFSGIEAFKTDTVLKRLLVEISSKLGEIHLFLQNLPIQTEIIKSVEKDGKMENKTFHGLFDKETVFQLLKYSLYSCLSEYIAATEDPDVLRTEVQETKRIRRAENAAMRDAANLLQTISEDIEETEEETEMDMQEIQIQTGNKEELKERVSSFLASCLGVDQENKTVLQLTYREVIAKVNRSKEREKRAIIEDFGKLGSEERRVENMLKNFRIGKWNVGQQRGLIEYDKATFDREIQAIGELEPGNEFIDEELERNAGDLQREEDANADEEADAEAYNIADLGENYMDGEYYPEDRDEDFMED